MSAQRSGPPRSSRSAIVGSVVVLVAVVVAFGWIARQSFNFIHDDVASLGTSKLKPVEIVGAQKTLFDWSKQACEQRDIPDIPARAFRDARGDVHLIASGYVNRAMVGPDLNRIRQDCRVVMRSTLSGRPQLFADEEWIAAPYTFDGKTVFSLVHDEYHGWQHTAGDCFTRNWRQCLYNAVTLARSDDSGESFRHAVPPPGNLVASVPYRYVPGAGTYGVFNPSNIVKKNDYYYSLVVVQPYRAQAGGTCIMRTRDLADPGSWRFWDGDGYNVTFMNPYKAGTSAGGDHTCQPVSPERIGTMSSSLTFNTYFGKFLLVGTGTVYDAGKRRTVNGFYYSLSDDLIHWSQLSLIHEAELPWTYRCGDADPVLYPSVLDPTSKSRNFETTGRHVNLYFTRFHYTACRETLDRDLVQVPITFSK
jgi:hypothetical protein